MITILTPAYNRGYIISKAYKSLLAQADKDFEWLVIDDGSTDNTKTVINDFIKEDKINIRYYKKENGGKHTAINYGLKKAKGSYVLILDSDDYLTDDAIKKVSCYWKKYDKNEKVCAISFLKTYTNGEVIGKRYEGSEIVSNNISFRYNNNLFGDMCEVYRTDVLKKYPFPVYQEERFLSEAIVWNKIAFDYDTVYVNEAICVCEYLDDGLSKGSLNARIKSPIGALENAKLFMDKRFKLVIRIKNSIIYTGFSLMAKRKVKKIVSYSEHKALVVPLIPLGYTFYLYLLKMRNRT